MNEIAPEWGIPFLPGVPRSTIAYLARLTAHRLAHRYGVRYRVTARGYGWYVSPAVPR